jgi:hypothetical protein
MTMHPRLTLIVMVGLLAGCAGMGGSAVQLTDEEIPSASSRDLCLAWKHRPSDALRAELQQRDLFSRFEWTMIEGSQIQSGMSELAVLCSWGEPERVVVRESSPDGDPVALEWAYNTCPVCNEFRVYLRDGEVERWER